MNMVSPARSSAEFTPLYALYNRRNWTKEGLVLVEAGGRDRPKGELLRINRENNSRMTPETSCT